MFRKILQVRTQFKGFLDCQTVCTNCIYNVMLECSFYVAEGILFVPGFYNCVAGVKHLWHFFVRGAMYIACTRMSAWLEPCSSCSAVTLLISFFKDSQLYCLEQLCRLKKKKRKCLVLGLSMPYCCKNGQDGLVPANMLYLEMPAMKLVANQEAKTKESCCMNLSSNCTQLKTIHVKSSFSDP